MKTKAVRLYGKRDLRIEEFELPPIRDNEILAKVVSDSLCMSSYKAAIQGSDHKRIPDDVAEAMREEIGVMVLEVEVFMLVRRFQHVIELRLDR